MPKPRIQQIEILSDLTEGLILNKDTVVLIVPNGTTTTAELQQTGGGDITTQLGGNQLMMVDDGVDNLVSLTHGTDEIPVVNYVYCVISGSKAILAGSTTQPTIGGVGPFAPVAEYLLASNTFSASDGFNSDQLIMDKLGNASGSHITHMDSKVRSDGATWLSGVDQTMTRTVQGAALDDIFIATTSGIVSQLHEHTWTAFNNGDDIYVANDFTTKNVKITNLNAIDTDTTGASLHVNNRRFNIVIWGMQSETGMPTKVYANAPTGFYINDTNAVEDSQNTAVKTFPAGFRGTGFLIARFVLKYTNAASGTLEFVPIAGANFEDLRGVREGGGGISITQEEFSDANFAIFPSATPANKLTTDASALTASRSLSYQDKDITVADNADIPTTASQIANVPAGSIAATDVQAAVDELDSSINDLDAKNSCRLASDPNANWTGTATADFVTGTGVLTISALTAGASLGLIDVVEPVATDRILLKDVATLSAVTTDSGGEATPAKYNGIWAVTGGTTTSLTLERTEDANADSEVTSCLYLFVEEGTVNIPGDGYNIVTPDPIVVNTTGITFNKFTESGAVALSPEKDTFIATIGQTAFALSATPVSEQSLGFYVNGTLQQVTVDYTRAGVNVTWLDTFLLVAGDVVISKYFS